MGELDIAQEAGSETADFEEISIQEESEDEPAGYYRCDPDDEETKYTDKFGAAPGQHIGCFGSIVMYFVNKKQQKARKNHKSLISRNQKVKRGFNRSVRRLKDRTMSMMSVASTNWKSSRMHLAESMTNLSMRSRRPSKVDSLPGRSRHMSMQDRLETYNEELASDSSVPPPRARKVSKISFDAPIVPQVVAPPSPPKDRQQVPSIRARKVSKVSMFEFVPEEKEKVKTQDRPASLTQERPASLTVPQ